MMTIKKSVILPAFWTALILCCVLSMGCSNVLGENPATPEYPGETTIPEGQGAVLVNIQSLSARTLLPSAEQLYYTATFTSGANTVTERFGGVSEKTIALPVGIWNLVVQGYRNPADAFAAVTPTVSGSASGIDVSTGETTPAPVVLTAPQTGMGTLSLSVSYPSSPPVSDGWIKVEQIGGAYTNKIDIKPSSDSSGFSQRFSLESGYYHVSVYLFNGENILNRDVAHVYDNLETPAVFSFTAADLAENADTFALNIAIENANAIKAGVKISLDGAGIPSGVFWVTQEKMDTLNTAIAAAQAIVALRGTGYTLSAISAATTTLSNAVSAFARTSGAYIPGLDGDIGLYVDDAPAPEAAAGKTLASALLWLQDNGVDGTDYTILLGNDETLSPWTLGGDSGGAIVFNGMTGVTLTLKGKSAERILQLGGQGSLFTVNGGVTLVLDENITLRGIANNNTSLVYVSGTNAKFEMKAESKITDNTSSSLGGVTLLNGTFTMSGGTISGNTASGGGGVYIDGGAFTMNSGTISGNTASGGGGGGVYVYHGGAFTMNSGTISGNTFSNTSSGYGGGGVYVSGAFTMNSGTISGNTSSSYDGGGGVYVSGSGGSGSGYPGTFTMSGGTISGNTASSYGGGGGVYSRNIFTMSGGTISGNTAISSSSSGGGGVLSTGTFTMSGGTISDNTSSGGGGVFSTGTFTMSGTARVALNNPVYIPSSSGLSIGGTLSDSDSVAALELSGIAWIGKTPVKWAEGQSGVLPVGRFSYPNNFAVNSSGVVSIVNAAPLSLGPPSNAWLASRDTHYYRIAATINRTYMILFSGNNYRLSAAYDDGSVIFSDVSSPPSFIANRTGDVIVMVSGINGVALNGGAYTLTYTEE